MKHLVIALVITLLWCSASAFAVEIKLFGVIQKITMTAPDAATATVTVKETRTDQTIVITVNDTLTLDKFRDKRIVEGDDIRCKYEIIDGKNISRLFKKTAGC